MCASCGCGAPNNDQGSKDNITMEDIDKAAKFAGITPEKVAQNIQQTVKQSKTGSQS